MIKAVLIDIDNTLLDFDAYVKNSMKDGFQKFGIRPYEEYMYDVFEEINTKLWREIEDGTLTFNELIKVRWNKIFDALGISFDGWEFEKYFRDCLYDSAVPIEGSKEILKYLSEKYIVCAASNGPYDQQIHRLEIAGMAPYFSDFYISEKIGASKPSEVFFDHCITSLNSMGKGEILPSEIMMIGDSLTSDMAGGVASGMKTCYFDRNKKGKTNGLKLDHIVTKLEEIKNIL